MVVKALKKRQVHTNEKLSAGKALVDNKYQNYGNLWKNIHRAGKACIKGAVENK